MKVFHVLSQNWFYSVCRADHQKPLVCYSCPFLQILEQIVAFVANPELQAVERVQEQRVQHVLKTVEFPACVTSL